MTRLTFPRLTWPVPPALHFGIFERFCSKIIWGVSAALVGGGFILVIPSVDGQSQERIGTQSSSNRVEVRRFTVRDSIEMARFGRVDYEPVFSPNGRLIAVVTSRGIIQSNKVESTLWVFTAEAVRKSLGGNEKTQLTPKIIARLAATPNIVYESSYEPIISNLRWTPDSQMLFFLVQNSSAERQLYQADVNRGSAGALTALGQDVSQFDFAGGTVVYRVTQFDESQKGDLINEDARDVTGMTLRAILFSAARIASNFSALWMRRENQNKAILDSNTARPIRLWDHPPIVWNVLSISPDGKSAVTLLPVRQVPKSWERYEPDLAPKIHAQDPNATADSNPIRLTQYAVIDLNTGKAKALVNAPNAWALGYTDRNRATWSSDGRKLLLINTYLPLDAVADSEESKRIRPCAAAVVDLNLSTTHCVSYRETRAVTASSFGQSNGEVILWFDSDAAGERFQFRNEAWQPEKYLTGESQSLPAECIGSRRNLSEGLSIQVEQDLNTPPVLSATDCRTGRHRKIWDPNPQLAKIALGEASEYRWKDTSGYEWTGALLKPPGYVPGKRFPLVIQTYGFAEKEFLTDGQDTTAFAARPLAAAGMMVLLFWHRFDNLATEEGQLMGFESAIEQLTSEGLVDASKVGIIGFSQTSHHVENALIKYPRRFAAATIADGADFSYLQHLLFFSVGANRREDEEILGAKPFGVGLQTWVDQAPGFHLDKVQTPLRIEALSPISVLSDWEIYASLWEQNKPVDLIYIPDAQHILQKPLDRMASQQGNVDWFRFWLQGEEDPDPTKESQYVRWRQLRTLHATQIGGSKAPQ
jgi:dipeptidyl aminopeptidase/acylaminoacyl peptidase